MCALSFLNNILTHLYKARVSVCTGDLHEMKEGNNTRAKIFSKIKALRWKENVTQLMIHT